MKNRVYETMIYCESEMIIVYNKNIKAIDKIIKQLSMRDYKARCEKLTPSQKRNIAIGKKTLSDYGGYDLSAETMEAIEVKHNYQDRKISEEEYKAWCLRYNLCCKE